MAKARLDGSTLVALDRYSTTVLTCPPELARSGGLHILPEPRRALPWWHGFTLPLVGLSFPMGAVVAARPDLVEPLSAHLGSDLNLRSLDLAALHRVHRAFRQVARHAFSLSGDFRAVDSATFRPAHRPAAPELISRDDPTASHLRARFDGDVFGIRGPHGRVISYAALKLKWPTVWEIAVATEPDYRGHGYAEAVVSAATEFALRRGRIVAYIHDRENRSSAFVARSLGFQVYCAIVLAEY